MELFSVENLEVSFRTNAGILKAVRGISFKVNRGEVLGIVGESGSGKSVTAASLINLLPVNSLKKGKIIFKNKSIFDTSKKEINKIRGKGVGMIFQEPGRSFDPIYTIGDCIKETLLTHNKKLTEKEIEAKTINLLEEVNIPNPEDRLRNFPHQLSGGLLQRIMIAAALAADPEVLIADEPTTALDVTIQAQIIDLLMNLKEKRNLSIIFITHDLSLIKKIADRVIVMYSGLILEEGSAEEVFDRPCSPYTKDLIDSLPFFGQHYSTDILKSIPGTVPDPLTPEPGCPFEPRCSRKKPECISGIPEIIDKPHKFRCIFPGEK